VKLLRRGSKATNTISLRQQAGRTGNVQGPAAINPDSVAPAAALRRNLPTYFTCQPAPDLKGG